MSAPNPEDSLVVKIAIVISLIAVTGMLFFVAVGRQASWSEMGFAVAFYLLCAAFVLFFWRAAVALILDK